MARRKQKDDEQAAAEATANGPAAKPARSNGYDAEKVKNYVARVEVLHDEIASIMGHALSDCKAVHADIKVVLDEAKDTDGIPKKALKKVVRARALERKAAEVRDELEGDDQHDFDMIRHALGDLADLPLGAAALAAAGEPQTEAAATT